MHGEQLSLLWPHQFLYASTFVEGTERGICQPAESRDLNQPITCVPCMEWSQSQTQTVPNVDLSQYCTLVILEPIYALDERSGNEDQRWSLV